MLIRENDGRVVLIPSKVKIGSAYQKPLPVGNSDSWWLQDLLIGRGFKITRHLWVKRWSDAY